MSSFAVRPDILEVTLRDGSYLIDFQFTAQDTAVIASALESVGFRWIEVGHGVGLNASATGKGSAAATDEQYMAAAAEALSQARWGMFFIPGIGTAADVRMAARYRMNFLRIGTNVTEVEQAEPFIKQAKDLGMLVSYNAMKSYAVSPAEWGRVAAQASAWGADIVCLVDSAGSMYPEDVSAYLKAAQAESGGALGFHGHDNLSLAMANTLRAIDEGAAMVDTSLQGMGRSAGNAITEILVAILKKRGMLPGIDMKGVMDVGAGLIQPLLGRRGVDPMAVTGGYASFHSSFTSKVVKYAQKHDIDVRDLIVRLCEEDLVSAPDDLLERLGGELANAKMPRAISIPAFGVGRKEGAQDRRDLEELLRELRSRAVKWGKFSALNAVAAETPQESMKVSGNVQSTPAHVAGSVTYSTEEHLAAILECVEGHADILLLDVDRKPHGPAAAARTAAAALRKTTLLTYLDSRVWADAVENQTARLLGEDLQGAPVAIAGDHPKSRFLAARLADRGARVALLTEKQGGCDAPLPLTLGAQGPECLEASSVAAGERIAEARLLVVWPAESAWFGVEEARRVAAGAYVVDAGIGGFLPEARDEAQRRGARLVRVDMWPAIAGALLAAHESQRVCTRSMGWDTIASVPVVAGGAMGRRGDVVVDSISEPSRVIGVTDGQGGVSFTYTGEEADRVRRVAAEINSRLVMPHLTTVA
jgi:4-hydroxy-2-oxovalerate aldolase